MIIIRKRQSDRKMPEKRKIIKKLLFVYLLVFIAINGYITEKYLKGIKLANESGNAKIVEYYDDDDDDENELISEEIKIKTNNNKAFAEHESNYVRTSSSLVTNTNGADTETNKKKGDVIDKTPLLKEAHSTDDADNADDAAENTKAKTDATDSIDETSILLETSSPEWEILQKSGLVKDGMNRMSSGDGFNVVQIGAHTGFETTDPIAVGMTFILDKGSGSDAEGEKRKKVHWTFVEASPANFNRLEENLAKHSDICDMNSINAAVVSDSLEASEKMGMVFYSIRDTVDPETGYDSLSGKTLPPWITQVSSFSKTPILYNRGVFGGQGLNVNDYIVETKLATKSFSELMHDIVGAEGEAPLLVLIDTEGFDCSIVNGISPSSPYLPKYLVFESKQCEYQASLNHLQSMGYQTSTTGENVVAIKKDGRTE